MQVDAFLVMGILLLVTSIKILEHLIAEKRKYVFDLLVCVGDMGEKIRWYSSISHYLVTDA